MNWVKLGGGVVEAEKSPLLELPDLIWKILAGRNITSKEEIQNLYQPKLKNLAHPFSIDQMDLAVARLIEAFKKNEKILIYGDYDLDGTPGVTLLYDGFQRLGFKNLVYFQPSRIKDGYGFHAHRISEFQKDAVQLIVTVDVGITDCETVLEAKRFGIDVILTDHHLPKEKLPEAIAVLNPNKGTCTSKLQHLCGTGVAFYLILALKMQMSKENLLGNDFDPKELLDLFALATITDMVPLIKENRILVKHGLVQLAKTKRPGPRRLFTELGYLNKTLTSQDVAFRIAPKLNALTRLDEGLRALDVLLADEKTADSVIRQVLDINQRRVEYQKVAKSIADKMVESLDKTSFLWIYSHEFHPGVVSLLANDIMSEFGVPVFVGSQNTNGQIIGSARSPSTSNDLQTILQSTSSALVKWGGHQLAAGFEVSLNQSNQFSALLDEHFKKIRLENGEFKGESEMVVHFDAEASISELDFNFMKWFDGMGPFGNQFEVPKILLKRVKVEQIKRLKNQFLKYSLSTADGKIEALWFKGAKDFPKGSHVDTLITPQWNEFNGVKSVQAIIQDMRLT